jgi:hypothetical protein
MKKKFGITLIVLAALMTFVDLIGIYTSTRNCVEMFHNDELSGTYDSAYKSGYVFGTVVTSAVAVAITIALYYYGLKLVKGDKHS